MFLHKENFAQSAKRKEPIAVIGFLNKCTALLGGSTARDIIEMPELFQLDQGIGQMIYDSEYAISLRKMLVFHSLSYVAKEKTVYLRC